MECCFPACLYLRQGKDNTSEWWDREGGGSSSGEQFRTTLFPGFEYEEMHLLACTELEDQLLSFPAHLFSTPIQACAWSLSELIPHEIPHHSLNRLELLMRRGKTVAAAGAWEESERIRKIGTSLFRPSRQDRTNDPARCVQLGEQPEQC